MSVIMTLSFQGDASKLEELAASDPDRMQAIIESAKSHGLIAHRFYATDDGEIMVIDEWPDPQSFQTFFSENGDRIGPLMQAAGVASEPQPKFWHTLDMRDEVGWD
jgi:hypothetical protein